MRRKIALVSIATYAIITIVVIALLATLCAALVNEFNMIDEGTIVDKHYKPAYGYYTSNSGTHTRQYHYSPESYTFTIEGTKDGKTVRYTFNVTEQTYNTYSIGDYYKR